MKRLTEILAHATDTIIARLWPLDATTRAYIITEHDQHNAAEWLANAEADTEVWEAPPWLEQEYADLAPWERELLECTADPDDLWAANHRRLIQMPADKTIDEFVTENRHHLWPEPETPAGAANSATQPVQGGAGRVTTDDVANVIAVILRGQGINSAPIYADLAARELAHHFHISRKKEGPCQ